MAADGGMRRKLDVQRSRGVASYRSIKLSIVPSRTKVHPCTARETQVEALSLRNYRVSYQCANIFASTWGVRTYSNMFMIMGRLTVESVPDQFNPSSHFLVT